MLVKGIIRYVCVDINSAYVAYLARSISITVRHKSVSAIYQLRVRTTRKSSNNEISPKEAKSNTKQETKCTKSTVASSIRSFFDYIISGLTIVDGNINLDTGLDADAGDLLDDLTGSVEIDEALVDAHLEAVPGVGTLTTGGLTGGDAKDLGGHADGAGNVELLVEGSLLEVGADLLEVLDVARGEGDADAVDNLGILAHGRDFLLGVGGHDYLQTRTIQVSLPSEAN